MPRLSARRGALLAAALGLPVAWMASRVSAPIDGAHVFRQAHVAANVEKYVANGLSLRPATYNLDVPRSLFDFPAFPLAVAFVCRAAGTPPVATARATGIVLYALCVFTLSSLLSRTRVRPVHALFTLVFFAIAPLNLFFFPAPMADSLAVCAALVSLDAFARWQAVEAGRAQAVWFVAMALSGGLSTMIKSPVYLPVFVAILAGSDWRRREDRPWLAVFALLIGASLVAFRLYANSINQTSGFLTGRQADEYFGALSERVKPRYWRPILTTLGTLVLNPWTSALFLLGVAAYPFRPSGPRRGLYLGLLAGALASLLIFFNKNRWHSYYQLPDVLPLAFFAGYGVDRLWRLARGLRRRSARVASAASAFVLLAVAVLAVIGSKDGFARLAAPTAERLVAAGDFIRNRTRPDDFVFYVAHYELEWNPAYLYFAQRDGYNLPNDDVNAETVTRIRARAGSHYRRFFAFRPESVAEDLQDRLDEMGARLVDQGAPGALYLLAEPR